MAARDDRKTKPTDDDPRAYLESVPDPARRADALAALALIERITGAGPQLWGSSIVGFGRTTYVGSDRVEREWFAVGLAPRKAALTFYGLIYYGSHTDLLERLGRHTTGKGCLYVKRLSDVDLDVLTELVELAWEANLAADDG